MYQSAVSQSNSTQEARQSVPGVADLSKISDAVERNKIITAWYHEVDRFMSAYIGDPELPCWARFAKHASYNAGLQLRNMKKVNDLLDRVSNLSNEVKSLKNSPAKRGRQILSQLGELLTDIGKLASESELIKEGFALLLKEAGIKQKDIDTLLNYPSKTSKREKFRVVRNNASQLPAVISSIPKLVEMTRGLYDATATANQRIYEFMAPLFFAFASEELGLSTKSTLPDPSAKFLSHAFSMYKEVRHMGWEATLVPITEKERLEYLQLRSNIMAQANVIATFGEQLYRVQPQFEKVRR